MSIDYCPCGMPRTPEASREFGIDYPSLDWERKHLTQHLVAFSDSGPLTRRYLDARVKWAQEREEKRARWNVMHVHVVVAG